MGGVVAVAVAVGVAEAVAVALGVGVEVGSLATVAGVHATERARTDATSTRHVKTFLFPPTSQGTSSNAATLRKWVSNHRVTTMFAV